MPTDNTYSPWNNKIDYCFIVADKNQSVVALEIGMNRSEEVPEGIHNITHAYVHTFVQCAIVHAHEYLKYIQHECTGLHITHIVYKARSPLLQKIIKELICPRLRN